MIYNNKCEQIIFKYISYTKIKFFKKYTFQTYENLFIFLFILLKNQNDIKINFKCGREYTKVFCLVKGPKCHKSGKHLLKYNYFSYYLIITKNIYKIKNLNLINKYIEYIKNIFKIYDSNLYSNNKIVLNTYINIFK